MIYLLRGGIDTVPVGGLRIQIAEDLYIQLSLRGRGEGRGYESKVGGGVIHNVLSPENCGNMQHHIQYNKPFITEKVSGESSLYHAGSPNALLANSYDSQEIQSHFYL